MTSSPVTTTVKASSAAGKMWSLLALSTLLFLSTGASDTNATRYNKLGHRMMCACDSEPASGVGPRGCQQILLECSHVGCGVSKQMSSELKAALDAGNSDDAILRLFVQKYGSSVIDESTNVTHAFYWTMAFAALVLALGYVGIVFTRRRQSRLTATIPSPLSELDASDVDMLRRRIRAQTEHDDC